MWPVNSYLVFEFNYKNNRTKFVAGPIMSWFKQVYFCISNTDHKLGKTFILVLKKITVTYYSNF